MKKRPDDLSPYDFWGLASGFRDAGECALATIQDGKYSGLMVMPCVFLFFRTIELSLKSVLASHDVAAHEIRKLSHDISRIMDKASKFTSLDVIGIASKDRELLKRFSRDYQRKGFEYSNDWWNTPHLDDLRDLAVRVCEAVRVYRPNQLL